MVMPMVSHVRNADTTNTQALAGHASRMHQSEGNSWLSVVVVVIFVVVIFVAVVFVAVIFVVVIIFFCDPPMNVITAYSYNC
jgi:hypothetical protein